MDTTRADHLGCYNPDAPARTPGLDAFAARSMRFAYAFTTVPTTLPTFTSVMTGCYPHTHGVPKNGCRVPDDARFLSERLGEIGYRTAAFIASYALHSDHNFNQGFDVFNADFDLMVGNRFVQRDGATVSTAVISWLENHLRTSPNQPFFCLAHYFDPHLPYRSHPDKRIIWSLPRVEQLRQQIRQGRTPEVREAASQANRAYADQIEYMDEQITRLLEFVRATPALTNTLVVVFADHGERLDERDEELYDHGRTLFDTSIHVPLMIAGPSVPVGVTTNLVSLIDIAPTLCTRIGLPLDGMEGEPIRFVGHAPQTGRQAVFSEAAKPWSDELEAGQSWPNARKERAIRTASHKLIRLCGEAGWQFFDLNKDPDELQDCLAHADAAQVEALRRELADWKPRGPEGSLPRGEQTRDAEALQKLRSIGYGK